MTRSLRDGWAVLAILVAAVAPVDYDTVRDLTGFRRHRLNAAVGRLVEARYVILTDDVPSRVQATAEGGAAIARVARVGVHA